MTGERRTPRIVVVGSVTMDLVLRCTVIARPGETLTGRDLQEHFGGKGANQAVAAARLGAEVWLIGRVGSDGFGDSLLHGLQSAGVRTDYVQRSAGASGVAVIQVEDSGQNSIVVIPGANGCVTSADVLVAADVIRSADVLLVQFEVPLEAVETAVGMAAAAGVTVIVDPAPARREVSAAILSADWLVPNETEAEVLTGSAVHDRAAAVRAARQLQRLGAKRALVTMGADGVLLADTAGRLLVAEPFRVRAVDTTAAGDAFAGALAYALAGGVSESEAVRFACAAGALTTTRHGAQSAVPGGEEVRQLLQQQPEAGCLRICTE
ncbi:MAG: ribokinase [Planctomyces sp.]